MLHDRPGGSIIIQMVYLKNFLVDFFHSIESFFDIWSIRVNQSKSLIFDYYVAIYGVPSDL